MNIERKKNEHREKEEISPLSEILFADLLPLETMQKGLV